MPIAVARSLSSIAVASSGLLLLLSCGVCPLEALQSEPAQHHDAPTQPGEQRQTAGTSSTSAADKQKNQAGAQQGTQKAPEQSPEGAGPVQLETPTVQPGETPQKNPPAPPAEQFNPGVIESIVFRGNRRISAATLRARIFSRPGNAYDENTLERDFMALWNTGFFDDIRLESSDGQKGKIVTFYLREKKLVRSIDYKGLSTVSQSDVLDRFKQAKVGLSIESQYDPVIVKRAEVTLTDLLAEHGRMFATVRARTRNIPPNSVALTFLVVEGPTVKVGTIRFTGNKVFSNERLIQAMKYSKPAGAPPWFYWFHKTYDKDKIEADLEKIREFYQEHGYFYAVAQFPATKIVDTHNTLSLWPFGSKEGKRMDINIPIDEGEQYRLGRFLIHGNKLFTQQQLAPVLQIRPGDIFNLTRVRNSLESYRKLYGGFGYIDFVAEPEIEPNQKKHTVDLTLDFQEGQQFFVHRIEFDGNTKTRDKVIRRELLVNEGELFNTTFWDYSILKINQLGFFDTIKKEDYDVHQNPQEHTVDINVKVKEKGKNSIGFSGGVSGLAGTFVGANYATNNFLGLGETLSINFQYGTFQRLISFGFTEPYFRDTPVTTGFTVYKSDYHFDQLRQVAVATGTNPASLQALGYGGITQNYEQNSSGFTVFASYPLRRTFARVGLTYNFSVSSVETFNTASQLFFESLAFAQFQGPNQLEGITSSQFMPTFVYNTLNSDLSPTRGKYLYAALGFAATFLGGNVNTIQPIVEAKYFHTVNHGRHVVGLHFKAATISGFGGLVPPPFSRFYMGGENDIRGFDFYTISPAGFFPTTGQVCNRDSNGNQIPAIGSNGQPTATCGSFTRFPYNTIQFAGGDTELLSNFEYRIPIASPVTLAYFIDFGGSFIFRPSQLKLQPSALSSIAEEFPYFPVPGQLNPVGATNRPRGSTGLEFQFMLPIINAPFRVYAAYNWLRLDTVITPPQDLPPESLFPNVQTYNQALTFFAPLHVQDRRSKVGFTVSRTF